MPLLSPQDTGALLALIRTARDKPLGASLSTFTTTVRSGLRFQALVFAASVLEVSPLLSSNGRAMDWQWPHS